MAWGKRLFLLTIIGLLAIMSPVRADDQSPRIKVLNINIWGIYNAQQRPVRIEAITKKIIELDPDIIAIEEAFSSRHRRIIKRELKKAGYPVKSWKYFRRYYGSGILFISKFPIEKVVWKPYVVNGAWNDIEWLGGKGIAYFLLDTPFGKLDFFLTHAIARMTRMFDDEGNYIEGDYNEVDRFIHMYQIDRFVRENRIETGRSMIAAGDFNVNPTMPEYGFLMAMTGFENSFDALHPGENPSTYSKDNMYVEHESSRIDHIFFKNYKGDSGFWVKPAVSRIEMAEKFVSSKTGEQINYSDHYGVYAEFEVVREEGSVTPSPVGLGAPRKCNCHAAKLSGYADGVITLTGENVEGWKAIAFCVLKHAYMGKNRKATLVIPMAQVLTASIGDLPAEIKIREEHRSLIETLFSKRS